MNTLKGEKVLLRALEPEDLEFIFKIENNEDFWEISATQIPFSKYTLQLYLKNAHRDIYEVKQQRFVVENEQKPVGLIDLFDFDPQNRRAGVGIIIEDEENRGKGFGKESLLLLKKYAFTHLNLHQLYANISAENENSIFLFEKIGFQPIGLKKEWNLVKGQYKDEVLYQLINRNVH